MTARALFDNCWECCASFATSIVFRLHIIYARIKEKVLYPRAYVLVNSDKKLDDPKVPPETLKLSNTDFPKPLADLLNMASADSTSATPGGGEYVILSRNKDKSLLPPRGQSTISRAPVSSETNRQKIGLNHRRCTTASISAGGTTSGKENAQPSSGYHVLRNAIVRREAESFRASLEHFENSAELIKVLTENLDEDCNNLIHLAVHCAGTFKKEELPPRMPTFARGNSLRIASTNPQKTDKGGYQILSKLLDAIPNESKSEVINRSNPKSGFSPLHIASLKGELEATRLLLSAGADPNVQALMGSSPLHLALGRGNDDAAALLLESGSDPNAMTKIGLLPLMTAVRRNSVDMVRLLLSHGANPRLSAENAMSPIALAVKLGSTELLTEMETSVKRKGHRRMSSDRLTN